jgi:6-phosphogluconolactonase/glucosamine-6-phosphate isomerase/deaminase
MFDLSGKSASAIAEKISNKLSSGGRIWIGFSTGKGNDNTLPELTELLKNSLTELDRKRFSSKIRGNSLELCYYEKTQKNKESLPD